MEKGTGDNNSLLPSVAPTGSSDGRLKCHRRLVAVVHAALLVSLIAWFRPQDYLFHCKSAQRHTESQSKVVSVADVVGQDVGSGFEARRY